MKNLRDRDEQMDTIRKFFLEMDKDLLEKNLNPYSQNKGDDTCVHIAIRRNHFDFIYAIVDWSVRNNISCA